MVQPDEKIKTMIVEALDREEQIDASKINVDVQNGKVTLTGEVPSAEAQSNANWISTAVEEVTDVINHLNVRRPATLTMPNDEKMED
jgi:osmotically-inducible protein OsmY